MKKLSLSILGLGLLAMGCGASGSDSLSYGSEDGLTPTVETEPEFNFDRASEPTVDDSGDPVLNTGDAPSRVVARDGMISASVRGFEVEGALTEIFSEGDIEVFSVSAVRNDDDSAMVIVDLEALMHPAFVEVGRTTRFRNGTMVSDSAQFDWEPYVNVRGCVGESEGNWEVDDDVEEVEVTVVSNDENGRLLSLQTEWISAELLLDVRD